MDECIRIVRALMTGDAVSFDGEFFQLDDARITPAPTGITVVSGGRADAALRRAGRLTDGWIAAWVTPSRFTERRAVKRDGVSGLRSMPAETPICFATGFNRGWDSAWTRLPPEPRSPLPSRRCTSFRLRSLSVTAPTEHRSRSLTRCAPTLKRAAQVSTSRPRPITGDGVLME